MTHRTTPPPRICPNCDGHASAAITLGGRDTQGNRRTITAYCPACHGTGTTLTAPAAAGRAPVPDLLLDPATLGDLLEGGFGR
ncbi:hypothetical protein SALBM311S_01871 [Streptomyces alboniger]